jgi:hypothetical protein
MLTAMAALIYSPEKPLITRPTTNIPMFCEAQTIIEPIHLQIISLRGMLFHRGGRCRCKSIPDNCAYLNCAFTAKQIRDITGNQSAEPRTTRHGGSDTTLHICARAVALIWVIALDLTRRRVRISRLQSNARVCLLEVAEIWIGRNDGRHGSNVEAKESAANDGGGRDHVDISHGIHIEESLIANAVQLIFVTLPTESTPQES